MLGTGKIIRQDIPITPITLSKYEKNAVITAVLGHAGFQAKAAAGFKASGTLSFTLEAGCPVFRAFRAGFTAVFTAGQT